jgi:hypothetical protein
MAQGTASPEADHHTIELSDLMYTIADLTAPQSTDDGTNPAQLTALSHETRLITVGIGGNDIGFAPMIKRCVAMGALYELTAGFAPEDAPCARRYGDDAQEKTKAAGVGYVDTYKPSEGRDACSAEGTRWIEPLLPKSPAAAMHPNERGERGMADAVLREVRSAL